MEPDAFNVVSGLEAGQPQCLRNGLVGDDSRVVIAYESDAPFASHVYENTVKVGRSKGPRERLPEIRFRIGSQELVMCGRYRLSRRKQLIEEYFETENEVDWEPRYNIAPSQPVGIIRQDPSRPERHFSLARWGLIPSWATDASIGFKTINARAETVANKPAFRDAFVSRRCLLPADGFFEWRRSGKEKQPFHFGMQDDSLFAFAGLWDRWRDPTGTVIESCSILTTTPNSLLADVHDRMPVILRQENYDLWLDPGFKDVKALAEVLAPFDAAQMRSFPVSTRINAVANDDPDCVVPWHRDLPAQSALFG